MCYVGVLWLNIQDSSIELLLEDSYLVKCALDDAIQS